MTHAFSSRQILSRSCPTHEGEPRFVDAAAKPFTRGDPSPSFPALIILVFAPAIIMQYNILLYYHNKRLFISLREYCKKTLTFPVSETQPIQRIVYSVHYIIILRYHNIKIFKYFNNIIMYDRNVLVACDIATCKVELDSRHM